MDEQGIQRLLSSYIREDEGGGDLTTAVVPNREVQAQIVSKQKGTAAGVKETEILLRMYDIDAEPRLSDGGPIQESDVLFDLEGESHRILLVERTALNILTFMSGIATLTSRYADEAAPAKVAATRKTHPGFRWFEKKAVKVGGGLTHRWGLSDLFIIKDNHIEVADDLAGIVEKARKEIYHKVEVEAHSIDHALEAAEAGADIIMLDNMTPETVKEVVEKLKENDLRDKVILEASGGITMETVSDYGKTGVEVISLGELTQASPLDMALKFL